MTKEEMRIYQQDRRARIRGGTAITTVAGLAELYRELDNRIRELEKRVDGLVRQGEEWLK